MFKKFYKDMSEQKRNVIKALPLFKKFELIRKGYYTTKENGVIWKNYVIAD